MARGSPGEVLQQRAEALRAVLVDLGAAAVKIGQAVSSRPDVAPPEVTLELEKLQDQIPPFPSDQAMAIIHASLGAPASAFFSDLSPAPVAAASLGQVYVGTLRADGRRVAVKVQRPGVASLIALDIYILRWVARRVQRLRRMNTDLAALLDEWAFSLFRELDYRVEAQQGTRFKELYGDLEVCGRGGSGDAGGAASSDDLRLVDIGVRCSLEQMLEQGYYHADPHPGNLLKTRDGRLAYIDFGMMGEIDGTIRRRGLLQATLHLINREYEALADDFAMLGMLPSEGRKEEVVAALTGVFAEALSGGVNNLSFGELSNDLANTMYQFKFQIPSYYTLLVRSLSVLEGIALASNPDYKVLGATYPWVARRLLLDTSPELRSTLLTLLYKNGRFQFDRLALGLLLSPRGDFLRSILVDELAKGVDSSWRLGADGVLGSARRELRAFLLAPESQGGPAALPFASVAAQATLSVLFAIPPLAEEADVEQVEGMRRLAAAVNPQQPVAGAGAVVGGAARPASAHAAPAHASAAHASAHAAGSLPPPPDQSLDGAWTGVEAVASAARWLARESATLGKEERAVAAQLPLAVAQALSSRLSSRAIQFVAAVAREDSGTAPGAPRGPSGSGAVDARATAAAATPTVPTASQGPPPPSAGPPSAATYPGISRAPVMRPLAAPGYRGKGTAGTMVLTRPAPADSAAPASWLG
ncbi:putative aarF domain-containing protein kinase, chloroplastic [Auxenochlorella protothecoides]|uniref:Putative aarF domain-containing protein kinase, chloroplastic n=1 Tax=Auxenochlorella protothecoides TaxID=3075 RepID=A0A087SGK1_AUXPR|nr:putative aarF domain-containing protein kinase, chloroplastic [Auxenochlorella protothecoides]KFM24855.1 putative aarF domain-containing protein kinase, chloroplastic [Auxenochlorella protothecoides]